jgi:hypothetical protein
MKIGVRLGDPALLGAQGGSRTLNPFRASPSEDDVYTNSTTRAWRGRREFHLTSRWLNHRVLTDCTHISGAPREIRTPNRHITKVLLYQLELQGR